MSGLPLVFLFLAFFLDSYQDEQIFFGMKPDFQVIKRQVV